MQTQSVNQTMILLSVFFTGMAVLIIEILAARILAPYFGNSIFTFSSVISVILAALSIGYYLGGRLSDWRLESSIFYNLILLSGIAVLILDCLVQSILPMLSYQLNMIQGPLITSLLLFFLPAFILAILSPYAIRLLQQDDVLHPGRDIGKVFFWSTIGSIFGSLGTGFFLIPHFPVDLIIVFVGYGLLTLAIVGLIICHHKPVLSCIIIILIISAHYFIKPILTTNDTDTVYQHQGRYEQLIVLDKQLNGRPIRLLLQDKNTNSGMYLDDGSMLFDYTKYYELYKLFSPETKSILAIGGGAYSVPKSIIETTPDISVDVVEIEDHLYDIAQDYFFLTDSEKLRNHVMDGRRFLYRSGQNYDVIFSDVYHSFAAVPMHFATQDFFQLAYDRLNEKGVFIANFFGSTNNSQTLIASLAKTLSAVFPQWYVFATIDPDKQLLQNFIFVGHKHDHRIDLAQAENIEFIFPELKNITNNEYRVNANNLASAKLFTDNYAPVEYLAANSIKQYEEMLKQSKTAKH